MVASQIDSSVVVHGRIQDLPREVNYFLGGGGGCLLGGFGGMLPRKKNLNCAIWYVLEHIFINFLLSKSLKISFFYKNNYKL